MGRRTYAEVVVETFSNLEINREIAPSCSAQILQPTASTSSITTDFRGYFVVRKFFLFFIIANRKNEKLRIRLNFSNISTLCFIDLENMPFYSGNPFVEKTSGVIHFYKWRFVFFASYESITVPIWLLQLLGRVFLSTFKLRYY